ncbi:hypothetical protein KAU87_05010 [Candidatus Bathyarchaeota archaeon]|nr:hypothetical protein [Candidatus Bathyarchaeota archaeon]
MSIRCEHCGAPYRGSISPYSKFVTCENCGCAIGVSVETQARTIRKVVYEEESALPQKIFDISEFERFLVRKRIKTFDSTSGILKLGSHEVLVKPDGSVDGSRHLKSRVEKWIQEFMASE